MNNLENKISQIYFLNSVNILLQKYTHLYYVYVKNRRVNNPNSELMMVLRAYRINNKNIKIKPIAAPFI